MQAQPVSSPYRFFLLDAMALIYRAYYAMIRNPRITSYGKNTNASLGFTNTLIDILNNENPTHIAVAFDSYEPTERHEQFSDYKANRQPAPEDLINSLDDIKQIIAGFNIPVYEAPGYEADDIIGTIAAQVESDKGFEVYMVTPDKDYGQLVRDNVFIYKPPYVGKGFEKMGEKEVCEKWDIHSISQVVDMLALMGDASDNIPGIAGIGEKTAAKLLKEYHSLDNIIQEAASMAGTVGKKVQQGIEAAQMSYMLAQIITDVPVDWSKEECLRQTYDEDTLRDIFETLEFRTLSKRLFEPKKTLQSSNIHSPTLFDDSPVPTEFATIDDTPHHYEVLKSPPVIKAFMEKIALSSQICIDTETDGLDMQTNTLLGVSICVKRGKAVYIPCIDEEARQTILDELITMNMKKTISWIGHNIKFDMLVLKKYGVNLNGSFFDTMIAQYIIEQRGKKTMDALSEQYLNYKPISIEQLIGSEKKNQKTLREVDLEQVGVYAAEDADITLQLYEKLSPILSERELSSLAQQVEFPLLPSLVNMEYHGVKIDTAFLNTYSVELENEVNVCEKKIHTLAGEIFNISSPKQLGDILFEKLKITENASKTKTKQYATGEEVLAKLLDKHPIVPLILDYRELQKLKSTYVDALPKLAWKDSQKVHTSYHQAVAVTGRLSSQHPNLQNIPIRTAKGRKVRQAFIPEKESNYILSADYSQIELRIIASMSGDGAMCKAFQEKKDVHKATAASVYNVPLEEVSTQMRYHAKSVNFGIIYGQGAWGLSGNLKISLKEAKQLIQHYFEQYPQIKEYMNDQIAFAQNHGYVKTLMGRKRYLPDITSANATVRSFAERNAINSPIQGSAADMIKIAMIRIDCAIREKQLNSKMILQVHDELVFDVPQEEVEEMKVLISMHMKEALPLSVPIEVTVGVGENWLEAH